MIFLPFPILPLQKKTFLLYLDSLMMGEMIFLLYLDFLMMVAVAYRPFRAFPGEDSSGGLPPLPGSDSSDGGLPPLPAFPE
jgi:hypothetical protein